MEDLSILDKQLTAAEYPVVLFLLLKHFAASSPFFGPSMMTTGPPLSQWPVDPHPRHVNSSRWSSETHIPPPRRRSFYNSPHSGQPQDYPYSYSEHHPTSHPRRRHQEPTLPPWTSLEADRDSRLDVEKQQQRRDRYAHNRWAERYAQPACCKHCQEDIDRRRRNIALVAGLVVFLLYTLGNMIFLNVRVMRLSSAQSQTLALPPLTTISANASNPNALASDAQACLSQFALNAPSNPTAYPCSSCLTSLQNVPQSFAVSDPTDGQYIMNAIQFCGLRSIFENANPEGQTGLSNGGWAKDVRFCAWSGVRCDGDGRVSSIQLTFPAVPAKIPDELQALTGLTSLQIVGDMNLPAGTVPLSLQSLNALTTLHLESTALTEIPAALLKTLTKLNTIILARNAKMSNTFMTGVTSLGLVNLIVHNQVLQTSPLPSLIANAAGKSLRILDLSATSLSGSLPGDLSFLSSLVEMHLDNNALEAPLPTKFPTSMQSFTLMNNTQLTGAVAPNTSFCALPQLKICDVRGTGLTAQGDCGLCKFK